MIDIPVEAVGTIFVVLLFEFAEITDLSNENHTKEQLKSSRIDLKNNI